MIIGSNLRAKALAGALLFGAGASIALAPTEASAAPNTPAFSQVECNQIAAVVGKVVQVVGVNKLSAEFRRSLGSFIVPDGKNATCTGPTKIATPKDLDIDAFNTIRVFLARSSIDLQARGLRSVASIDQAKL